VDIGNYEKEVETAKAQASAWWEFSLGIGIILFPTLVVTIPVALALSVRFAWKNNKLETSKVLSKTLEKTT